MNRNIEVCNLTLTLLGKLDLGIMKMYLHEKQEIFSVGTFSEIVSQNLIYISNLPLRNFGFTSTACPACNEFSYSEHPATTL